ncbi:hypothetical protein HDU67_000849 [Dinochytrium kinnereticum]|nr:hypothetical protein HDU67_000849 [Dinochytrium kinnereticum]
MTARRYLTPALFTLAFLVLVALVVTTGLLNHGDRKYQRHVFSKAPDGTNSTFEVAKGDHFDADKGNILNQNVIVVKGMPVSIDPAAYSFRIRFSFFPNGDFAQFRIGQLDGTYLLRKDMTLMFDSTAIKFTKGSLMPSREIQFGFTDGDINHYPFDVYTSIPIMISGKYHNGNASELLDVPIRVEFTGSILSWTVDAPILDDLSEVDARNPVYRGQLVELDVTIKRAFATIFFSIMVMFILWLLSLMTLGVVIQIYFRNRKVEPPTAGMVVCLLFALPAVRNAQPGAPQIGCISDIVSFFWAMAISGVAGAMILINYTIKYKIHRPKPAHEHFEKPKEHHPKKSLDEPLFHVGADEEKDAFHRDDDAQTLNDDRRPLIPNP